MTTVLAQDPEDSRIPVSLTTHEHLLHEPWWPTMQFANRSQFAGTQACARCHGNIVRTQAQTQMALTMMPAANSTILATHTGKIFTFGSYRYAVEKSGGSFTLKVSDGGQQRTDLLQWAFGSGTLAQSYVFQRDDSLYESRFNYFSTIQAFDRTPGRLQGVPVSLDMAEGRKMAEFEVRKCYSCHSTGLTTAEPLNATRFDPGITCEGCHGPGVDHIAAVKDAASSSGLHVVNPAKLSPLQSIDFCGACHGTPRDVELMGMVGKVTVRFPAYRLTKSHCWGTAGDARLACFACHNPHRPLQQEAAAYDAACLRCHGNGKSGSVQVSARPPACPVATSRCTTCHMPSFDIPGMHYKFTDHNIRIVKANAPFPD